MLIVFCGNQRVFWMLLTSVNKENHRVDRWMINERNSQCNYHYYYLAMIPNWLKGCWKLKVCLYVHRTDSSTIEHFKKSLDNGEYVACLSMDLSKVFDCLPHCLTICKLYSYGVPREACTLIASYLRGRKQWIKLGTSRSEWAELLKGVPQGSILGPLIFSIFLYDIFYFVSNSDLYNYADDNCINVSHKPWAC